MQNPVSSAWRPVFRGHRQRLDDSDRLIAPILLPIMSHQFVTPELRRWILSQAEGGYPVETVLKSMIQAGWDEKVAVEALESTLKDHLKT